LLIATILTLVFLPTLYVTWFGAQDRAPVVAASPCSGAKL